MRGATWVARARGCGASTSSRWPTSAWSWRAARWIVSPSGTLSYATAMGASLNIAALSKRTGIPVDTIRKWEQRYGVLHPERTTGGQRRYTERDVARLTWLIDRLQEGYRIGEAATLLGDTAS
jgi:hypothetical protein